MSPSPMALEEAVQDWLNGKTDLTQSSINNNRHRLDVFTDWCRDNGITTPDEITGKTVHDFKVWRSQAVAHITLRMQLGTIRQFLRWGERMDLVAEGVGQHMKVPTLTDEEEVREDKISVKEAEDILEYLNKFNYASFDHVAFYLMWHTGCRLSTIHAFDVSDFHPQSGYIEANHRPDTDTPLKNKKKGQREINLKDEVVRVVQDWIDTNHPEVTDEYGRKPLMGSKYGRAHTSTIRDHIYRLTRPCVYAGKCPHDYDPDTCDAARSQAAFKCPSSYSPHALRKGAITFHRNNGINRKIVSDRADVSEKVLDKHYDMATEAEKRERRRESLDDL